jgi:Cof subfamily protein (haloacid dehalogenase superfamily)
MIRLVCIDVDGTLVGSAGAVPPKVWEAADRLRARGVRLALCSGRPAFGVTHEYARRLDPGGWHIFQNGASVLHLSSGESRSAPLAPTTVALLVERARRTDRILELYADAEYAVESRAEVARVHATLLGVPFNPRPFDSLAGAALRALWLVEHEDAAETLRDPHPGLEVSPSLAPGMPGTTFVNLTLAGVDKASGVRAIARAYGIELQEVMFVGDGRNDVTAMHEVGVPVAMGNAEEEARDAARIHVGHVDDGGLAEALALAAEGGRLSSPAF